MIRFSFEINNPQIYKDIEKLKETYIFTHKFQNDSVLILNEVNHKDLMYAILELGYDVLEYSL